MADLSDIRGVPSVSGTDDREARSKSWIALYSRPRSEKKVKAFLDKLGIEAYLPIQKQMRQWSDRKKLVDVVVIPMVIFVNADKWELYQIINHPLILRPFTLPGCKDIAKIPADQIERLKFILGQSDVPVEFDTQIFETNDNVEVIRGHFMGLKGEVHECFDGTTEVIVRINLLGGAKLKISKCDLVHTT